MSWSERLFWFLRHPIHGVEWVLGMNVESAPDENEVVVKTTRYLRLAMVGLVIGLGASLFFELNRVQNKTGHGCLLGSISAYYYTPVHAFFVGALVTIGVSLVALRGNTDLEDLLLNLAGVLAPFVALVPTERVPTNCQVILRGRPGISTRDLNVANNVGALLVVGLCALLLVAILGIKNFRDGDPTNNPDRLSLIGYGVILVFFVITVFTFWMARGWFLEFAHPISAIAMFVFIGINVLVNGYNLHHSRDARIAAGDESRPPVGPWNRYTILGLAMVAALFISLGASFFIDQWVFMLEASEIALFAVFWSLQTIELWPSGLRPNPVTGTAWPPPPAA